MKLYSETSKNILTGSFSRKKIKCVEKLEIGSYINYAQAI